MTTAPVTPLRAVAPLLLLVGTVGSVVLMLRAGGPPGLLLLLFAGWVVSPFAALAVTAWIGAEASTLLRARLDIVTVAVVAGSLLAYSGLIPMPPDSRPAFPFLMVPLACWLLIAIVILVSRRRPVDSP